MKKLKIDITKDLWTYLSEQTKPIVMYGMGNGADKIIKICEKFGIVIQDFFASDGFVRGNLFHGKPIVSYSHICEKYGKGNFIVLLSFASSLNDVIDNIKRIASENELYAPDVPVCGEGIFTLEYFNQNYDSFDMVYSLLADNESKKIYRNIINYKLSGNIDYLLESESDKNEVFNTILSPNSYEYYADLGAYNGDTIRELLEYTDTIKKIISFEPDRRNFKKLDAYTAEESRCEIYPLNVAAWSCEETLLFDDSGNRNSNITNSDVKKVKEILGSSLDFQCKKLGIDRLDYIKYDVEGAEKEAIIGSKETIISSMPDLLISLYHRNEDIFAIPLQIKQIAPEYKLYIRRFRYIPAWDLNLYCIKK